jgi:predicted N-acetyltransferase YhbS
MITVRPKTAEDFPAVRRSNELAFGLTNEVALVNALRVATHPQEVS